MPGQVRKRRRGAAKSAPAFPPAWRHALLLAALAVAAALAYRNSFRSGFVVDNRMLLMDPRIHAFTTENLRLILTKEYWYSLVGSGLYRPLSTLSYLFNFVVLGDAAQPAGYHWINLALHVVNVALVYALGLRLFGKTERAFALAAVWGLHPLLTESVTNIVGRADLLSAFGVLAGLLAHVKAAGATGRRQTGWLIALGLAAAVALFSKESGIVLLAVMLIYDLAFRQAASWTSRAPGYAVLTLPVCAFLYARHRVLAPLAAMHIGFGDNPLGAAGFWQARITAIKVIGKYFWLLVWPARLSCDYSYNQVPLVNWPPHTWGDWQAPIALLVCLAAAAIALLSYRRRRLTFFFIAFFFVTLAPTTNLLVLIGTIMAERFLYLPSLGFAGCLVLAVYAVSSRWRGPGPAARYAAPAVLAAVSLAFAVRAYARNSDWLDDLSLWTSEVEVAPASYKSHMARASALVTAGAPVDEAIAEIGKTFAILRGVPDEKNSPAPYIDAGSYYGQKGESLARRNPNGSLESTPESTMWYRKSLDTLLHARRIEAANNRENRRLEALRGRAYRDTGWYELYLELAAVYLRLSEPGKALEALAFGRKFQPVPEFFEKTADAYTALGDTRLAAVYLAAALLMDPNDATMTARLANLYQGTDPGGCTLRAGGQGLNMDCPRVHEDFCAASVHVADLYKEAGLAAGVENAVQKAREMRCQ